MKSIIRLKLPASKSCLTIAMLLLLAPYPAKADDPQRGDLTASPKNTGLLETSAGVYAFTPRSCASYEADGVFDIEIQGPGTAPDGEMLYFELTSTGNAMTIELGVDGPFKSSDRKIQAGQHVSKAFTVEISGQTISVADLTLVDEQGTLIDANASLRIDCSA